MATEDEEFEFRARAEREAQFQTLEPQAEPPARRTPTQMQQDYTSTFLPVKRTAQGEFKLAVPGLIQSMGEALTAPGRALQSGGAGDYLPSQAGPSEAEGVNVAMNVMPFGVRGRLPVRAAEQGMPLSSLGKGGGSLLERAQQRGAIEKSQNAAYDESILEGRKEGLRVFPENAAGQGALLLGGRTAMRSALRDRNRPIYDRMAREESGLGPNEAISRKNLEAARTRIAAPYRELERMSPKAGQLWREVQDLRVESRKMWDAAQTNVERDAARAVDAQVAAKEAQIDKIAQGKFQPDQLKRLRSARKALAKNYMVDEANVEGTGHVDERIFQRALNNDRPMSGKLLTAARFKNAEKYANEKILEGTHMGHVGIGAGAHAIGGGLSYPGIPFLGKAARSIALSRLAQGGERQYGPGLGVRLGDLASRWGPFTRAHTEDEAP